VKIYFGFKPQQIFTRAKRSGEFKNLVFENNIFSMQTIKRLVVKFGTASLLNGGTTLDREIFSRVARQIAALRLQGIEIIIVSSGAVAAGREELAKLGLNPSKISKKVLAGAGAMPLLRRWSEAFKPYKIPIGQVWVTYRNWCDKGERASIATTISESLLAGIVPVINENDVVSQTEILSMEAGLSDNDWLAAKIAWLINADAIIFFSDAGAVFEANPETVANARRYREINAWDIPLSLRTSPDKSKTGRGGIKSKLMAAASCSKKGMRVSIASLNGDHSIVRFAMGENVGTMMGTRNILCE